MSNSRENTCSRLQVETEIGRNNCRSYLRLHALLKLWFPQALHHWLHPIAMLYFIETEITATLPTKWLRTMMLVHTCRLVLLS